MFALLLLSMAYGAYIYGDIYTAEGMQKLEGAVIKIKGEGYSHYLVPEKSNYSIQLPDGRYSIIAEYYGVGGNVLYSTSKDLYLSGDDVRLDLVLANPASDNMLLFIVVGIIVMGIILFNVSKHVSKAPIKWEEPKEPDTEAES